MLMNKITTDENAKPTKPQCIKSVFLQTILVTAALILVCLIFCPILADDVSGGRGLFGLLNDCLKYVPAIGGYYIIIEAICAAVETLAAKSLDDSKWTIYHIILMALLMGVIRVFFR